MSMTKTKRDRDIEHRIIKTKQSSKPGGKYQVTIGNLTYLCKTSSFLCRCEMFPDSRFHEIRVIIEFLRRAIWGVVSALKLNNKLHKYITV